MPESPPAAPEKEFVERSLRELGWRGAFRVVKRVSAGASRSQVFLLDLDGDRVVLKTTEDPDWRERAEREFAVYHELAGGLGDVLPEVRAAQCDRQGVRLLLTAYAPHLPAPTLTSAAWVAIAGQLGRLQNLSLPTKTWLTPRLGPSSDEVTTACRFWDGLGFADCALQAAAQLTAAKNLLPFAADVLTHGDCHLANVLQGPGGRNVWIDWQEVCLSNGLDDLVFLWQRAEFDGAHPPREAMTLAYAAARSLPGNSDLRVALTSCELRLLLVAWPAFLRRGREDRQRVMTQRLEQLVLGGGAVTNTSH